MSRAEPSIYPYLRQTKQFARMFAPIVSGGCLFLGVGLFLRQARSLLTTGFGLGERVEIGVYALVYLGGFALAAALVYRLLRCLSDVIDLIIAQATATERAVAILENSLVPAIERLAETMQTLSKSAAPPPPKPTDLARLSTDDLLTQLRSAKKTGDPDELLDLREQLVSRLNEAKMAQLDRDLAMWLSKHFQKALLAGKAPLVAASMGRAVEALSGKPEIYHLEEALPMVRRSAGLCPRCGQPYRGTAESCPACSLANGENRAGAGHDGEEDE